MPGGVGTRGTFLKGRTLPKTKQMKMEVKFHGLVKSPDRQFLVSGSQIKNVEIASTLAENPGPVPLTHMVVHDCL